MILITAMLGCAPAECGSYERPVSDPSCPCVTYAAALDASYRGTKHCRPDQTGRLEWPLGSTIAATSGTHSDAEASGGGAVLVCECRERP